MQSQVGCFQELERNRDNYCNLWKTEKNVKFANKNHWDLYYSNLTYMNQYLHVHVSPRKRKIENEDGNPEVYCVKLKIKVEQYFDFKDPNTYSLMHEEVKNHCFHCDHDNFDCSSKSLVRGQLPLSSSHMRVRVSLEEEEKYRRDNFFMSFRFSSSVANAALFNELFWIKLLLLALTLGFLINHFMIIKNISESQNKERNYILTLIRRQLCLQILMNDPFFFMIYIHPNFLK